MHRLTSFLRIFWLHIASRTVRASWSITICRDVCINLKRGGSGLLCLEPGVFLAEGVKLFTYGGSIEIGENTYIGHQSLLYGHGGLKIGKNVLIGPNITIIPANHRFERIDKGIKDQGESRKGISIGDDVWIGSHVVILDGVTIGSGAVIAAGTVVSKSIPSLGVCSGNPVHVKRLRG